MISEQDKIFKNLPHQRELTLQESKRQGDLVGIEDLLQRPKENLREVILKSRLREKDETAPFVSEKWKPFIKTKKKSVLLIDGSATGPGDVGFLHLIYYEPYKIIEGALLTAFMTGCGVGYFYVPSHQTRALSIIQKVLEECYAQGILGEKILGTSFSFHLYLHWGSSEYVSYTPQKILDSLAGEKQSPGTLFDMPALIHKVETVAALPTILKKGVEWFSSLGTPQSPGTKVFSFSGHVNKPCVFEENFGVSLRSTLDGYAGGIRGGWSHLNCIFPSSVGSPVLPKTFCNDLMLSYEGVGAFHSWLGSGTLIVVNGSFNWSTITLLAMDFFLNTPMESCLFCIKGIPLCVDLLKKKEFHPKSREEEILIKSQLNELSKKIEENCRCGYAHQALNPIKGYLRYSEDLPIQRLAGFYQTEEQRSAD